MRTLRNENEADTPRRSGFDWGSIFAYTLITALILLALVPLLAALK